MAPHALKKQRLSHFDATQKDESSDKSSDMLSSKDTNHRFAIDNETPEVIERAQVAHKSAPKTQASPTSVDYTQAGYGSSILKLQVDEFLIKSRKDYERRTAEIDDLLRKLKNVIEQIPGKEAAPIVEVERSLQEISSIRIPFPPPRPTEKSKYLLAYAKPANIKVVGTYAQRTALRYKDDISIDLAVTMPSTIFQSKDYLNYRYFHKRAYYLACIASGIKAVKDLRLSISYIYQNDNHLQPILLINQNSNNAQARRSTFGFCIRIILAASDSVFPLAKTLPDKNCVRLQRPEEAAADNTHPATPFYNATLRSECCTLPYSKLLAATSAQLEGFDDACRLGGNWLRQRSIGTGLTSGGFGQFEWAALLALLLQGGGSNGKPVLSKGYSSLQLFKATLQFIATKDLAKTPIGVYASSFNRVDNSAPVLYDGQRGINILFKMTEWSYRMLRHEAQTTLQTLSSSLVDQFALTFISRTDFVLQRFDTVIRLCIPQGWKSLARADATDRSQAFCQAACKLLSKGLGNRLSLIYPWSTRLTPWSVESVSPVMNEDGAISIGLLLKPDQAFRTVDQGPSTEQKAEAAAFRHFWGEKAELRRFRDGSILETLVWNQDPERSIVEQIIHYLVERDIGSEAAVGLRIARDIFNGYISNPGPLNVFSPMLSAFETFENDIRGLEGMPLQIRQVSTSSADLRFTSLVSNPDTPLLQTIKIKVPADVCVQFEGSTRWPNDLAAIQRTKMAFLLKIGELLESNKEGLTASIGLENETQKLLNNAFLDVVYPNAAAFRLRIHHEHELVMLNKALKDTTTDVGNREDIASAVGAYKRTFVQAPAHTQAVRALCTRHPLLSPSIRLMKKWRDSHLLSDHITDELIELLTIRTFVTPYPYQTPGSLATAFFRTLNSIAKWDWYTEPLIVDFCGAMTTKEIDAIRLRFEGWRKIDPAMNRIAFFAASDIDPEGVCWTEQNPSKVVAARFTELARAASNLAKERGLEVEPDALFTPSMIEYDFIIHVNARFTRGNQGFDAKKSEFKNLQLDNTLDSSLVGYDPVQLYLEELRTLYGSNVLFFHGTGGSAIAGMWNPQTGSRPWKANVSYSTVPIKWDGEEMVSINRAASLNDMVKLGGDLIAKVEVK